MRLSNIGGRRLAWIFVRRLGEFLRSRLILINSLVCDAFGDNLSGMTWGALFGGRSPRGTAFESLQILLL